MGSKLFYKKLNYKERFIRTIWMWIFAIFLVTFVLFLDVPTGPVIVFSIIMAITGVFQLGFNYSKWKEMEKKGSKSQ
ncbi:hypothetical protein [Alkalibacillus silvisoli]|uniref:Uncharacterized protein n=1 Tax=Alkalibacillus silvisoli TaxID=392823 RepID=A0ABN1A927_9BACI